MIPIIFGSLDFQLGNPNSWKVFRGQKYAYIYRLNTKLWSTMHVEVILNYILVGCPCWIKHWEKFYSFKKMTAKLRLVYKMVKPFVLTFSHNILSILSSLSSCNNGVNSVLTCFSSSLSCTSKRKTQHDTITLLHAWKLNLISCLTAWMSGVLRSL